MSTSDVSRATDERPLLESNNDESAQYELLDPPKNIEKKSSIKLVKSPKSPIERYEAGKMMLITFILTFGIVIFLAMIAGLGVMSRQRRIMITRRGNKIADQDIKTEEVLKFATPTKDGNKPAPEETLIEEEPHIVIQSNNSATEETWRETVKTAVPPKSDDRQLTEDAQSKDSVFSDDAIDALVASAARYAETVSSSNETHIAAHLRSVFFELRSNPKEFLDIDFGPMGTPKRGYAETEELKEEMRGEREEDNKRMDSGANGGIWGDRDGSAKESAWGKESGSEVLSDASKKVVARGNDVNQTASDSRTDSKGGDAVENYDESQKEGFIDCFWDFVARFAMDTWRVTRNSWDTVFGREQESRAEMAPPVPGMASMESDQKNDIALEIKSNVSENSQLKLLISKVRNALRKTDKKMFRATRLRNRK